MFQSAVAQPLPPAQVKKTTTPPVIDGNANDAVWANAEVHDTDEFFAGGAAITPDANLTLEWRALWDDTNLYVMAKINDDAIVNSLDEFGGPDVAADWNDDSIEFYIDAQDVNNTEYSPGTTGGPTEPTYQFTALAGWTPEIANTNPISPRLLRDPPSLPNTSFTWGINSYDGNQVDRRYPQDKGTATSGPVTANPAGGFDWTFEAAFPWEALEETPADILAEPRDGIFGFGVAYNDDDNREGRDRQPVWGTTRDDLWHVSAAFPDAQLVDAPAPLEGDYNSNGTVDAADYVRWRDNPGAFGGDPGGFNTWKANFGKPAPGAGSALDGGAAAAAPEPATLVLLLMLTSAWLLRRFRR
jgi:oligosaccharide reducing-end xylanase